MIGERAPAQLRMHSRPSTCGESGELVRLAQQRDQRLGHRRWRGVPGDQRGIETAEHLGIGSRRSPYDRGSAGERLRGREPEALELLRGHHHDVGCPIPADQFFVGDPAQNLNSVLEAERLNALANLALEWPAAGESESGIWNPPRDLGEGLDELAHAGARHHAPGCEQEWPRQPWPRGPPQGPGEKRSVSIPPGSTLIDSGRAPRAMPPLHELAEHDHLAGPPHHPTLPTRRVTAIALVGAGDAYAVLMFGDQLAVNRGVEGMQVGVRPSVERQALQGEVAMEDARGVCLRTAERTARALAAGSPPRTAGSRCDGVAKRHICTPSPRPALRILGTYPPSMDHHVRALSAERGGELAAVALQALQGGPV